MKCSPIIFVAVILIAVVSLATNFILILYLRSDYQNRLIQQVWPNGLPEKEKLPLTNSAILLFGDSRIAEWRGFTFDKQPVINAGIPGATTAQLLSRLPQILDEFQPRIVIIQAGINDLKLCGLKPKWSRQIVDEAGENLRKITEMCANKHCCVLLLETWPSGKPGLLRQVVWDRAIENSIPALNEQLRKLDSPSNKIWVIDLFAQSDLLAKQNDLFRDALHLKPETYELLTPALLENLKIIKSRNL